MEHHSAFHRHTGERLPRALLLSLALHGALAATILVLPRAQSTLNTLSTVTVDLSDRNDLSAPSTSRVAAHDRRSVTAVRPAMALPTPAEKIVEEQSQPPSPPPANEAKPSSLSLGMSRGFFRSLADGETLRSDIKEYYFTLVQRINEQWWSVAGQAETGPGKREALVTVVLKRNGEIFDVRLLKSSGSPEYDRLILNALQAAPLPPLPDSYPGEFFQAPFRLMAPLGLLS
ncbi:energy transducer TonB [Geobacter pickeringii]|uniref:Uncharacterized protein n=1 Tax=Geobacter pickeringii TaxID=345632 RepID=A0A0B5BFK6_9BACT|nr:energy transducer TonB [Geobacter pickeringii]AJE03315.1 hypothetical protein GPICK_08075 [Geobacter pickeringii]